MTKIPDLSPAAGWLKHPEKAAELLSLELPEIAIGSLALEKRGGNTGDVYYSSYADEGLRRLEIYAPGIFINSMGIPTLGFEWFCDNFKFFVDAVGAATMRVSISPFAKGDLEYMVDRLCRLAKQYHIKIIIEVNLSCPNVWSTEGRKPIVSNDPQLVEMALIEIRIGRDFSQVPIAVKVMAPLDPWLAFQQVKLCAEYNIFEVVAINTIPGATLFNLDTGRTVIDAKPENGDTRIQFGGYSGFGILPIAVGSVLMYKQAILAQSAPILVKGIGGICNGYALRQHELAGADSFAVGGYAMDFGGKVFPEILEDYLTKFG